MLSLTQAVRTAGPAGEPLPGVWEILEENNVKIRRGSVTMIAAAPGVGKSVTATNLAAKIKEPTLFFSADTDSFTLATRMGAVLAGHSVSAVEAGMGGGGADYYEDLFNEELQHVRFSFDPNPSLADIDDEVQAFAVLYGDFPSLIIVDNAGNLYPGSDDEWTALRKAMDHLNVIARFTRAAVVVLHHLDGSFDNGTEPPPLSALRGKISKIPALVINLYRGQEGWLGLAVVKNRHGPSNAAGGMVLWLNYHPERCEVS